MYDNGVLQSQGKSAGKPRISSSTFLSCSSNVGCTADADRRVGNRHIAHFQDTFVHLPFGLTGRMVQPFS